MGVRAECVSGVRKSIPGEPLWLVQDQPVIMDFLICWEMPKNGQLIGILAVGKNVVLTAKGWIQKALALSKVRTRNAVGLDAKSFAVGRGIGGKSVPRAGIAARIFPPTSPITILGFAVQHLSNKQLRSSRPKKVRPLRCDLEHYSWPKR